MNKKYIVELTDTERKELKAYVNKGTNKAYKIKHANILLKADSQGSCWTDKQIAEAFACDTKTVYNVRRRFNDLCWLTFCKELTYNNRYKTYIILITLL